MIVQRWLVYALLSAVAAAFVGIFGKLGMKEVDSNLATALRSVVMSLLLVAVCTGTNAWPNVRGVGGRAAVMIVLSGVAGAVSWLFYFRAIQAGPVSGVAPVDKLSMPLAVVLAVLVLGERPTVINWLGVGLVVAGGYLSSVPGRP